MKKFIYLFMTLGLVITTACDPMEDVYDEIDAYNNVNNTNTPTGEITFEMDDEDYDALDLSFGNFDSTDDAKGMIPELLTEKYPVWGKGSLADVTFKVYAPKKDERSIIRYTVSTEDYDAYDDTERFNNFDDESQIYRILNDLYPNPADRVLVSLTYKFYDGSTNTLNNGFLYLNNNWEFIQGFTDDEYGIMGEGFPNFSSEDEADAKIPIFLEDKFKFAGKQEGDIEAIMYKLYTTDVDDLDGDGRTDDSTTYSFVKYFAFDGVEWFAYNNTINETIKFGHDGDVWVPDNTIKYTLTGADFTLIGDALVGKYDGPGWSAANYGNFDRRVGNENYWSNEMILEGLDIFLNDTDSGAADGQKYVISYAIYNGAAGVESMSVIKADGVWINQ